MVVVSSCREVSAYAHNKAQPLSLVAIGHAWALWGIFTVKVRKIGTSNQHSSQTSRVTRVTMAGTEMEVQRKWIVENALEACLSSDWGHHKPDPRSWIR